MQYFQCESCDQQRRIPFRGVDMVNKMVKTVSERITIELCFFRSSLFQQNNTYNLLFILIQLPSNIIYSCLISIIFATRGKYVFVHSVSQNVVEFIESLLKPLTRAAEIASSFRNTTLVFRFRNA